MDQIFLRDACFDVLFENEFIKMIMDKRKFVSVVERDVILYIQRNRVERNGNSLLFKSSSTSNVVPSGEAADFTAFM